MARLVGADGRYHRSDHGSAPCGAEARRPRARETERMRPCRECYPPTDSGLGQRKPSTVQRAPEVWAAVLTRSGSKCEVQTIACWHWPVSPHHRLRQSQGGPDTVENVIAVCDWCHTLGPDAIHRLGTRAYDAGLLVRREDGPPSTAWKRGE